MTILPQPPEPSLWRKFSFWIRAEMFKKEPIGSIALLITIASILYPIGKNVYYKFAGPTLGVVLEFTSPLSEFSESSINFKVENYSDVVAQGITVNIRCSSDTLIENISPNSFPIGTIAPNGSSGQYSGFIKTLRSGKGELIVSFLPVNEKSNIKPQDQVFPILVQNR